MRKTACILIPLLLLLLAGCSVTLPWAQKEEQGQTALYYVRADAGDLTEDVIVAEYPADVNVYNLQQLLERYFEGPASDELASPFPEGTSVISARSGGQSGEIVLSAAFFTLDGVEKTLACCALTKTVCEYTGLSSITLTDETGQISMELQPEGYLLHSGMEEETETTYILYFADENNRYLLPESRSVSLSENEIPESYLLRELLAGPEGSHRQSIIPEGTEINSVLTEDGICTVDLSEEFYASRGDTLADYMTIYGIVDTLTELDGVSSVLFLMNGKNVENYGIFPIQGPVNRYAGAIGPARGTDISLFVLSRENDSSFAVPVSLSSGGAVPTAEAVLQALLDYEPLQGFYNPVPAGTKLLSLEIAEDVCYADFSAELLETDSEEAERAALWAIAASLTQLDSISSVVFTVDGESSGFRYADIRSPLTAEDLA